MRSTNDGVRTQAIRFLENVVLMYSDVGPTQTAGLSRKEGQCLQSVPPGHAVLNRSAADVYMRRWDLIVDGSIMRIDAQLAAIRREFQQGIEIMKTFG